MSLDLHTEVERKYDVTADVEVPDLTGVGPVASVSGPDELHQVATYFDTSGLRLLRAGMTVRRRTGGVDDGWHAKLPVGESTRREVQRALQEGEADDQVPDDLLAGLRAVVRRSPVVPVAVLRTRRLVRRLHDTDGRVLGELTDDHVEATVGEEPVVSWREWELELVDGTPGLFDDVEPVLADAGASPSSSGSKLRRVLAARLSEGTSWREAELAKKPTAGGLVRAYVAGELKRLEQQDQALKSGDQEGVHQLRVAARRLRSALATYRPVLDRTVTEDLRDELQWFGGTLSHARDLQVLRVRMAELLDGQPEELVLGPVRLRLDDELAADYRSAREEALAVLDGDRYFALLDRLESFVVDPPVTASADKAASSVLPRLLRRDLERVRSRHRQVLKAETDEAREHALHEVRKAAKRLRYAAEGAAPVVGSRATRLAAAAEDVQDLLGELQDTVVARQVLRDIGVHAYLAEENAFTFGRLHAVEEATAARLAEEYLGVYAALPTPKQLKRW